ncbi:MAG: DUF4338 domain-containing protein [Acidobacteria bacterium]|nr:DUF4338 domain-containing protein [Acidobacteriota bacterium]
MRRYCGREFTDAEMAAIGHLIDAAPDHTRRELSRRTCELLGWIKPDGGLKDMSCRLAMLRMEQDGLIKLPAARATNFAATRLEPTPASAPEPPLTQPVHELAAPEFHLVREKKDSRLWNEYVQRYHYLGYKPLPGAQLRYFVSIDGRFVALFGFGAAAWKTAPRDQFIGWTPTQRLKNMHLIVNNARFLILPWVQSKGLASKILARVARLLPAHWQQRYGYRPVLLETFVQTDRFRGTCYKAANWIHVGQTQGRGKLDRDNLHALPIKSVWVFPLSPRFRATLTE